MVHLNGGSGLLRTCFERLVLGFFLSAVRWVTALCTCFSPLFASPYSDPKVKEGDPTDAVVT